MASGVVDGAAVLWWLAVVGRGGGCGGRRKKKRKRKKKKDRMTWHATSSLAYVASDLACHVGHLTVQCGRC